MDYMGDLNVASLIKATLQGVFAAEREGDDARATSRVTGKPFFASSFERISSNRKRPSHKAPVLVISAP